MTRIVLALVLPAALLAAANLAARRLLPPPLLEKEAVRIAAEWHAEGPVVFVGRNDRVILDGTRLVVADATGRRRAAWAVPAGAVAKGFRLADLDRNGRYEIFVLLEDEARDRVEEVGLAFRPYRGEVARGVLVPVLVFPLRAGDATATFVPADAPAGVWPDLLVERVGKGTKAPPERVPYDAKEGRYPPIAP